MRWTIKTKPIKRIPNDEEKRLITKFLWFPKSIDNKLYRWLEKVSIKQMYIAVKRRKYRGFFGSDAYYITGGYWRDLEFVD